MDNDEMKRKEEESRLDSRFNFFLVGTAFLIAAFAVVVTATFDGWLHLVDTSKLRPVAHAINALGLYIALLFAAGNYYSAWFTKKGKWPTKPSEFLKEFGCDLCRFFTNPLNRETRVGFVHTWLIPSFFAVFWIFTWFVLPSWWKIAPSVGVSFPVIYSLVICLVWLFKQRKEPKKEVNSN